MKKDVATYLRKKWLLNVCLPVVYWQRIITGLKESPGLHLVLTEVVRMFNVINFQALNVLTLRRAPFKERNARCEHSFSTLKYSALRGKSFFISYTFWNEEQDKNIVSRLWSPLTIILITKEHIEIINASNVLGRVNHLNPSLQTKVSGLRLKISSWDFLGKPDMRAKVDCPMPLPWSLEISFTLQKTYSVALLELSNTVPKCCSRRWHFWGKHKQCIPNPSPLFQGWN